MNENDEYYDYVSIEDEIDPNECEHCGGVGKRALLSGIEWDYCGPDYDTCPDCGGSGRG